MAATADRHLLFGLLALQNGLIDQAQLVAAFHGWTRDKSRGLAEHLVALGHLDGAHRPPLEGLAAAHLARHQGDVEKSLAVVSAGRSTRESLARIDDPEIGGSLAHVGLTATQHDDADQTATYSVGMATSDGQFLSERVNSRRGAAQFNEIASAPRGPRCAKVDGRGTARAEVNVIPRSEFFPKIATNEPFGPPLPSIGLPLASLTPEIVSRYV